MKPKNIFYILLLALFIAGGIFSLANCGGEIAAAENNAAVQPAGGEILTDGEVPDEPAEPEEATESEIELPPPGELWPYDKLRIDSNSIVGIAQSDKADAADLTFDDIKALIREAVELAGGLGDVVKDGDTVVLKPNLVNKIDYCLPGWRGRPLAVENNGVVTDWRVTRAVAQLVREINPSGKIYVMEGSAVDTLDVMKSLNYTKEHMPEVDEFYALEKDSGEWQNKNSDGLVKITYKDALLHKEYYLNKKLYEADVLINLPTLKNHWDAVVTGNVKNLAIGSTPANIYGNDRGNPGRNNMVDHGTPDFHKWIADFYSCRPADFVITEALQGIENGPTPCYDLAGVGKLEDAQKNMRAILASKDGLAIDIVQTNIINWDVESVGYLQHLIKAGKVGNGDSKNITVLGVKVDDIRSDFAGVIPGAGGKKLTKKTPPSIAIESAAFDGQNLKLKLGISDDTVKLDIYIGGFYAGSVNSNMTDVALSAMRFDNGNLDIAVYAYDKYMNSAAAAAKAEKTAEKITLGQYDYAAPSAAAAPVIDGAGDDAAWAAAEWRPIDQEWLGTIPSPSVFSGRYKIVWTEDRLYYLVEIVDNYISTTRADNPLYEVYNDDCLELFINEDGLGGSHERSHNAFAYHMSFGGEHVVDLNTKGEPFFVSEHMNYAVKRTPGTDLYTWEVEMKIYDKTYDENNRDANTPVKLHDGKVMGFAVAYCDADETNSRERFIGSVYIPGDNKNVAWQNADVFAKLYLVK